MQTADEHSCIVHLETFAAAPTSALVPGTTRQSSRQGLECPSLYYDYASSRRLLSMVLQNGKLLSKMNIIRISLDLNHETWNHNK